MMRCMNEHRHHWVGDENVHRFARRGLTISCDECSLQCTDACHDCVVTFVLRADEHTSAERETVDGLVLDIDEARIVQLMARAGLVPELRFHVVS
jgi:hypothetical protein